MKIALYTSSVDSSLEQLSSLLNEMSVEYEIDPESTTGFDIAISYGGDGTFLSSVRKMGRQPIPVIGINSGRLGFLSTVSKDNMGEALRQLIACNYTLESRAMIKVESENFPEDIPSRALNEFTIQKSATSMISIEIHVDNQKVGKYWADGIILSTPTGSTAYSMSVGGAILSPECRSFIISPIAPHNLNIRPLVISDSSRVRICVETRDGGEAIATVDNREYKVESGTHFELHRSKYELSVIKLHGSNFYKTIREKLLWGVDPRN